MIMQDTKSNPNLIAVAFSGTHPFDAEQWRTYIDISWYELPDVGKIHGGFMKALGLQRSRGWPKEIDESGPHHYAYYTIRDELSRVFRENQDAKFILTGHSLGGALAILFVVMLILHEEEWLLDKFEGVYTFGQPRVGDKKFGEFMVEKMKKYDVKHMRYVYSNDLVPRIPYDDKSLFFKHFSPCLYFNSLYQGQILEEEPNKNYFSLFWVIPKILNAVWEVIRGFLLPFVVGREYKQNWFMTIFRLVGLIIPGIPAHIPNDYVNSTRLGSLNEHLEIQRPQHSKDD
ncbi:triacylglycerol lipase OBL1-like isoform X1 [Cicer arietinum]|uniref:Lipase-like n=1 Tax=Cicer arietinum TaxID=3827 RepID=A0A3Q7YEM8_CICAR|nr:lipase-like [Cicer arietinum]